MKKETERDKEYYIKYIVTVQKNWYESEVGKW